jgi:hypothetical protein
MNKTISDNSCECFCSPDQVYTILSVLGFVIPLLISEILPLSECEANGLVHGLIKLIKKGRKITPVKN